MAPAGCGRAGGGPLALAAAPTAGCREQTCTLIGCQDGASLTIRRQSGQLPRVDLTVLVDGRKIECPALQGNNAFASCDGQVFVTSREVLDCRQMPAGAQVSQTCTATGRFEQTLEIPGTPSNVTITAREGTTPLAEKAFTPQYEAVKPNGPDCEPTCRQWSEAWELP
jgi:hypothetical protein